MVKKVFTLFLVSCFLLNTVFLNALTANNPLNAISESEILDLTNNNWRAEKRWNKVGMKISKIPLTKTQKIANTAAVINMAIPLTAWPVTSPIIIQVGRKLSIKEKVKLR